MSSLANVATIGGIFLDLGSWSKLTFLETPLGPATAVSPARVSYRFEVEILGYLLLITSPSTNCRFLYESEVSILRSIVLADLDNCFPLGPTSGVAMASVIEVFPPAASPGAVQTREEIIGKLMREEASLDSPYWFGMWHFLLHLLQLMLFTLHKNYKTRTAEITTRHTTQETTEKENLYENTAIHVRKHVPYLTKLIIESI